MTTPDASLWLRAAQQAAGDQEYPRAALYVVGTPIGNRADLSLRALHVLALVDAIACEDTRHSAPLLRLLGLDKPLMAVHQHNEREAAMTVIARLHKGERVACISDAGTPAISDPGAALVSAVTAAGYRCVPIPGPSSAIAALSVAGDARAEGFRFIGFPASRGHERARAFARLAAEPATTLVLEAPHRIESLAAALADRCGDRRVTLCRELTKQFEEIYTTTARSLPAWLAADPNRLRGEFVVVLHALNDAASTVENIDAQDATLRRLIGALPLKQAVALAAELTGAPRNALYARALVLKAERA